MDKSETGNVLKELIDSEQITVRSKKGGFDYVE